MPKIEFFSANREKCCAKVNPDAQVLMNFRIFFCHFCHLMLCFKMKFSKKIFFKVSKLSLYLCFTADVHHLQDHFSNFLLNFSSLAKTAKKRDLKTKKEICAAKYAIV